MLRQIRPWLMLLALVVIASVVLIAQAGPLSDTEVTAKSAGIPVKIENVSCTIASARSTTDLPPAALVRLAAETAGTYYAFVTSSGSVTLATGHFLPPNTVEKVQNGGLARVACIMSAGTATLSISIMQ